MLFSSVSVQICSLYSCHQSTCVTAAHLQGPMTNRATWDSENTMATNHIGLVPSDSGFLTTSILCAIRINILHTPHTHVCIAHKQTWLHEIQKYAVK